MIVRAVALVAATPKLIAHTGFGDPVFLSNESGVVVYIGGDATVTNLNGMPLQVPPNILARIDLTDYEGEIWGYALGGAGDIRVIENIAG